MTVVYDDKKWTKVKSGYYICSVKSTKNKNWLHQYIYEKEVGKIPDGYHIHHIDGNKDNNDIANLKLLTPSEHAKEHGEYKHSNPERYKKQCEHLDRIRPDHVWPKDPEKYEIHREALKRGMRNSEPVEKVCSHCGKKYVSKKFGKHLFCSNKCKSAYRRKHGLDDVVRVCHVCGEDFKINKYRKTSTCSRSCANVLRARTMKNENSKNKKDS